MGFLDILWKSWGKSKSTLPAKEKMQKCAGGSKSGAFVTLRSKLNHLTSLVGLPWHRQLPTYAIQKQSNLHKSIITILNSRDNHVAKVQLLHNSFDCCGGAISSLFFLPNNVVSEASAAVACGIFLLQQC